MWDQHRTIVSTIDPYDSVNFCSYTFEHVHQKSDAIWKVQKYNLVQEYYDRPPLAPPLILFAHLFLGIRWILRTQGRFLPSKSGLGFRKIWIFRFSM